MWDVQLYALQVTCQADSLDILDDLAEEFGPLAAERDHLAAELDHLS